MATQSRTRTLVKSKSKIGAKRIRRTTDALKIIDNLYFRTPRQRQLLQEQRVRSTLGYLLSGFREQAGLTQTQLARKVGTTQSAIARIEDANYTGQKLDTIARIAGALGVPLSIQFGDKKFQIPAAQARVKVKVRTAHK